MNTTTMKDIEAQVYKVTAVMEQPSTKTEMEQFYYDIPRIIAMKPEDLEVIAPDYIFNGYLEEIRAGLLDALAAGENASAALKIFPDYKLRPDWPWW